MRARTQGRGPGAEPPTEAPSTSSGCGAALEARLPSLLSLWRGESRIPKAEAARNHEGGAGELGPEEIEAAGSALLRLQRGLTGARELVGASYMENSALLGAYLLYYWPVSYLETALALAMVRRPARRILDIGAGPGPASAAFLDAGAEELVLVDGSQKALDLARSLLESADGDKARSAGPPRSPGGIRSEGRSSASRLETLRLDLETGPSLPEGPFDALVFSHSLNELWKDKADRIERRLGLLEDGGAKLRPGGFLLVLEPALLGTSREALALRDGLVARGWSIAAPCIRQGTCPALAAGPNRSCHGEAAWSPPSLVAVLAGRAGLDRSSVKATWFAALPPGSGAEAGLGPTRGVELESRGTELGPARVVSEGMLNKAGRLRYLLCGAEGYSTLSAPAESSATRESGFLSLGRYDLLGLRNAERREGGGYGLGSDSLLRILERAPRP